MEAPKPGQGGFAVRRAAALSLNADAQNWRARQLKLPEWKHKLPFFPFNSRAMAYAGSNGLWPQGSGPTP